MKKDRKTPKPIERGKRHTQGKNQKKWMNEWGGNLYYSHGSPNSCGVMVLIRNRYNCTIHKTIADPLWHFIVLKVEIDNKVYILLNIYAPNKDKIMCNFFQKFT